VIRLSGYRADMGRVSSLARGPGLNPFFFPHRLECARRAVLAVRSPRRHNRRLAFPAMKPADQIKVLDAAVTAELSGTEVAMPGTSRADRVGAPAARVPGRDAQRMAGARRRARYAA